MSGVASRFALPRDAQGRALQTHQTSEPEGRSLAGYPAAMDYRLGAICAGEHGSAPNTARFRALASVAIGRA